MELFELEKKLNELQEKLPSHDEVFIPVQGYDHYLVSSFGRVKSLNRTVYRKSPRGKENHKYVYKGKILSPLCTGKDHRWLQIRFTR